nr:Arsenate reductase and related proteins, glutaredoxin family [Klebsiella pneumoniae]
MIALHPQRVIRVIISAPAGGRQRGALYKTYLQQFEQALKTHSDSAGVIKAMEAQWPGLAETSSLELSAKVNTGEMKW